MFAQDDNAALLDAIRRQSTLELPASLESRCERIGNAPRRSGSNYDIWKGELDGSLEIALRLLRTVDINSIRDPVDKVSHALIWQ